MGLIYKNGVLYGGGNGSSSNDVYLTQAEYDALGDIVNHDGVHYYITDGEGELQKILLTQAEYDALPDTKNTDGIIYVITDANGFDASNIAYSGSVEATDVQGAIDGLAPVKINFTKNVAGVWSDFSCLTVHGKMVHLEFKVIPTDLHYGRASLLTIPEGYRPVEDIAIFTTHKSSGSFLPAMMLISANGDVYVYPSDFSGSFTKGSYLHNRYVADWCIN